MFVVTLIFIAQPGYTEQINRSPLRTYNYGYERKPKIKYKLTLQPWCGGSDLTSELRYAIASVTQNCHEQRELAFIAKHESTGGRNLKNPSSTASGPYAFLDSSWANMCTGNKANFTDQSLCTLRIMRKGAAYDHWYRWWPKNLTIPNEYM